MKKILVIGAGACGIATTRLLAQVAKDEIVVVSSQSQEKKQSQFDREPTTYTITDRTIPLGEYIPTKEEAQNYHPFAKFIGKPKGKKGRW